MLHVFPPAGRSFSIEFDKCVAECGYKNTAWDRKFFLKSINDKPMLLIAHSDNFRRFGDSKNTKEWQQLLGGR